MEQQEIGFMPDRLNEEPVIFIGMTNSELKLAGLVSLGFWLPVCIGLAIAFGQAILGLAFGTGLAFLTLWMVGKKLRVIKRGRPKGYHVMAIVAWLEDHSLKPKTMIRETRVWDIQRHKTRGE